MDQNLKIRVSLGDSPGGKKIVSVVTRTYLTVHDAKAITRLATREWFLDFAEHYAQVGVPSWRDFLEKGSSPECSPITLRTKTGELVVSAEVVDEKHGREIAPYLILLAINTEAYLSSSWVRSKGGGLPKGSRARFANGLKSLERSPLGRVVFQSPLDSGEESGDPSPASPKKKA